MTSPQQSGSTARWWATRTFAAVAAALLLMAASLLPATSPAQSVTAVPSAPASAPAGVMKWKQIEMGTYFTCGLTTSGAVYCWGLNTAGQLGNGTTADSSVPVPVTGLNSGVASLAIGHTHACALMSGGSLRCWGDNSLGELGNGTTNNSTVPVQVTGMTADVREASAGGAFTCATNGSGALKCWGSNRLNELGALSKIPMSSLPLDVWGMSSGVRHVDAGSGTACAVTDQGGWCWGDNSYGQMGLGTDYGNLPLPIRIPALGPGTVSAQAVGRTLCALVDDKVQCAGQDRNGTLGAKVPYDTTNKFVPTQGLQGGIKSLAVGETRNCALTNEGVVKCWGSNQSGMLGIGEPSNGIGTSDAKYGNNPVAPIGLGSNVKSISAGFGSACAILADDTAKCWGLGAQGQLGYGVKRVSVNLPVPLGNTDVPAIVTRTVPDARQGVAYSQTLAATGGAAPYTWAIAAGALPDGVKLDTSAGVIAGTPTKAGTSGFTLRVTDSAGAITWSGDTWPDSPLINLYVAQPNQVVPTIASAVPGKLSTGSAAIVVTFTYTGSGNYFEVQCTNTAGTSSSSTSGNKSPLSLYWTAGSTASCRVRAQSSVGWSEWSARSAPVTP